MRPRTFSIIFVSAALLAGCGSDQQEPASSSAAPGNEPTSASASDYSNEELYGPRVELPGGLLLKQVGKVAEYGKPWAVRVVVDDIEVDPSCDEYKPDPERGHRVVLTLSVQTSADFDPATIPPPTWSQWSTVGPDGVSEAPMTAYNPCHPLVQLPSQFRPEATYRGEVDVDTANQTGRAVLGDLFAWDY